MRVLVVTNMYPPHHYGGYEINCQEFVTAMRAEGHDVLVLTSDVAVPGVDAGPERDDDVRRELRLYWADHVMLHPSLVESRRIEQANQRALSRAVADHRPDVVSAWHFGALSMGLLVRCRRRGLPIVHVVNDDWLIYGPRVDRWFALRQRIPPLRADLGAGGAFCFITETTRRAAEEHGGWRFPLSTVGYCGINLDDFPVATRPPRERWGGRLLHVGRIDDRKGIDTVIRALALLPPETTLDVVGRGDDEHLASLHRLAGELGVADRVRFGVAERSELAAVYAAADVLLFPPRWAEPFGLVPLEAMACSTPVVATGTGGSSEFLVDGVHCLRVAVDDHAAMAAAVERLAGDADLRRRLVAAGHVTAGELTLPRWLDLLGLWHDAAARVFAGDLPEAREPIPAVLAARLRSGGGSAP